jgi:mannitol-1-phosphate 5-dehydrogenase
MKDHVFVGFGFGPIQSGLFAKEAFESGNFKRIVIAEIDQKLVDAVRASGGTYYVNIAGKKGIELRKITGIEIYNPSVPQDRNTLLEILSQATEIVTSLPSVKFFDNGSDSSVAALISGGLKNSTAPGTIIYTAENNNHAAEILQDVVTKRLGSVNLEKVQFLNTVIGKMSQVVTDPAMIENLKIRRLADGIDRAFLVEEFNRILVTRTHLKGFTPGIRVFVEKDDLLPYEEAKLYGHNAIHALIAYLGASQGYLYMTQVKQNRRLMDIARNAFLNESGAALIKKYSRLNDELFTPAGYQAYADDLLERMTNPYLQDTIDRAGRDPVRKLSIDDRIFGTMCLALDYGIDPVNMACGALAGVKTLLKNAQANKLPAQVCFDPGALTAGQLSEVLNWLWANHNSKHAPRLIELVQAAALKK